MKKGLLAKISILLTVCMIAVSCSSNDTVSDVTTPFSDTVSSDTSDTSATEEAIQITEEETSTTEEETTAEETTVTSATTTEAVTETSVTTTQTVTATITEVTEPAPEWTEQEFSASMFVNTEGVYSRKAPIQGYEKSKQFHLNDSVNVVAKTSTDYYKTSEGDYIHVDYLSKEKVTVTTTTTAAVTTNSNVSSGDYIEVDGYVDLKIPKDDFRFFIKGELDKANVDKYLLRPVYAEMFKNIPGYVSGEFDFENRTCFKNLTKDNSLKVKELADHYWEDLRNLGWNSSSLSSKRSRVYGNLINLYYCAQNSNIGDYAPDGTQYVAKNLDGYCYTSKTELNNLYWLIAPRELKRLPDNTYCRRKGLGLEWTNTPVEGSIDCSGFFVIAALGETLISDEAYKNNWTPVDPNLHVGWSQSSPDPKIYEII